MPETELAAVFSFLSFHVHTNFPAALDAYSILPLPTPRNNRKSRQAAFAFKFVINSWMLVARKQYY
jgi:hypothetical protein